MTEEYEFIVADSIQVKSLRQRKIKEWVEIKLFVALEISFNLEPTTLKDFLKSCI